MYALMPAMRIVMKRFNQSAAATLLRPKTDLRRRFSKCKRPQYAVLICVVRKAGEKKELTVVFVFARKLSLCT